MKVKVQCPCGTRFEFEVEPVNERMPVPINCPACGADATELANAVIRQQSPAARAATIPSAPTISAVPSIPTIPRVPSIPQPSVPHAPAMAAVPAPTAPPVPPPGGGLRIARSAHAPAPAPAPAASAAPGQSPAAVVPPPVDAGGAYCPKHKTEQAVETCVVCKKPICLKCMEQFGYVCSVYCRQQATAKRIYVPPYANQKSVVTGRANAMAKYLTYSVVFLCCALFGLWIWYTWFARAPKVVYSMPIPKIVSESKHEMVKAGDFYQLIGPNQLLSIKNKQMALMDVTEQKQLWSVNVQTDAETKAVEAARTKNEQIQKNTRKTYDTDGFETTRYVGLDPLGFEGDFLYASPTIIATTNDIWVAARDRMARFDRQTGSRKDTGIPGQIRSIDAEENSMLVVSDDNSDGNRKLTQISLPDGGMQTEVIGYAPLPKTNAAPKLKTPAAPAAPAQVAQNGGGRRGRRGGGSIRVDSTDKIPVDRVKAAAVQATSKAATDPDEGGDEGDSSYFYEAPYNPYVAAGPNVVQMNANMLEHKTISHEVVRAPKKASIVDSGKVTAGQSLEAAQEMLNDMRRSQSDSKVEEDVSTYKVTLHRFFAKGIPDWTGEVTGSPQFIPCKTVDVVAAGKGIYVFDKNNRKLWEGKLTYNVSEHYGREHSPCLETKDALYVADKGILTRFELADGNVSWRLNSVGISKLQEDRKGNILVNTTTAGPETISYSEEVNIHEKIHALILAVAPRSGKVIWRQEAIGDSCMLSGNFLYATKISTAFAALRLEQGPDLAFVLRLLNPSSGNEIWQYKRVNQGIPKTEVQDNWIMLQFEDELIVMKFFSL